MSGNLDDREIQDMHLGWTQKQGYILSCGGKAEEYYTAERGFPFVETELPHYHIMKGDTHFKFEEWKVAKPPCKLVAGAWYRPLFVGGWKHSSDKEEQVYNIQTHNLFIDFRVPIVRELTLSSKVKNATSLNDLGPLELRLFARQHVFSGFAVVDEENGRPLATRHHCIDWNFVGTRRPRPNKWWIEVNDDASAWKEYAYAKDDHGQHYYHERWERLDGGDTQRRLALRISPSKKRKSDDEDTSTQDSVQQQQQNVRDGIFVLVGDHFNYILSRKFSGEEKDYSTRATNLVDLVDAAVSDGDLTTARSYLSIEAGHGRVSKGWKLDCAIPPWNEGQDVRSSNDEGFILEGSNLETCIIMWKGETWDLYDCSFETIDDLRQFLC
jgi:hypothetical protein